MSDDYDDDMPQMSEAQNEEEAPSGALPPAVEATQDEPAKGAPMEADAPPLDQVTDALEGKDAAALLKIASRYGVTPDDPLWSAILILLGSQKAAKETLEAAGKIEVAGDMVGEKIFTQTVKAGDDLKKVLSEAATKSAQEIVQKLMRSILTAIDKPLTAGVQKIEEASGGLDAAAQAQRTAILAEWRKDLTSAAQAEAKRRGSLAAATSWIAVLVTCVTFLIGGAILTHEYEVYSQHLLPSGYTLRYNQNGTPDCGAIARFGQVCGVNK
jgi:hypothetical protein